MTEIEATASYLFLLSLKDCLQYIVVQTGNSWHKMATKTGCRPPPAHWPCKVAPYLLGYGCGCPVKAGVVILRSLRCSVRGAKTSNPYDLSKAERKRSQARHEALMVVEWASAIEDFAGRGEVATLVIANLWVVEGEVESAHWLKYHVAT